ncbi:MAG TPA: hypothetical protein VEQ42_13965 [Pyrinomonadaceae bacterium]|nr:hypothetical protein [Pyrinomonadaceae bacterium]
MKHPCAPTHDPLAPRRRSYKSLALVLASCAVVLACASRPARADSFDVRLSVVSVSPPRVRVEGTRGEATKVWTFRQTYASLAGLAARLENLSLTDASGARVPARLLAPGEFAAERAAVGFAYEVKLEPPHLPSDAAHVSWLADGFGVLMPGDLLPLPATAARLRFDLPAGWSLSSAESLTADLSYVVTDAESTVFVVGRNLRQRVARGSGASQLSFVTTGEWAFEDAEAAEAAAKIFGQYERLFGGTPRGRALFVLAPFPRPASAQNWSAETRGRTVFLLSGRSPSKVAALAQLSVPLTHEVMHLWVPNALALDGEYDWFYEGFTLYQSARLGVRLGHLTFQDYLNAVGRAFDSYKAARRGAELSLPEASRQRWRGGASLVYSKGMLVAFLYDLTLRQRTSNKLSLEDVYRELFRRHSDESARRDGNAPAGELLRATGRMNDFAARYVEQAFVLDLASEVAPFGLELETTGARTRLVVSRRLSRAQRDLLRKLGYNE